jgi:hypothetical protein
MLRGDLEGFRAARATDFYENSLPLAAYVSAIERHGGRVHRALGNRPFPAFGRWPLVGPVLLRFYKSGPAQRAWRAFDLSGARFARFWGAGWWIVATKS